MGRQRARKGECRIWLADLLAHGAGQIIVALPPEQLNEEFSTALLSLTRNFNDRIYLAASKLYRGDDERRLTALAELAAQVRVPLVATNDIHVHSPERRPLQDVLTCIREHCTIREAGFRLYANAERHLKPPEEMARLFARYAGGDRPHAGDRRPLPLHAGRAALRIPGRSGPGRPHAAAGAGSPRLGGRRRALSRGCARQSANAGRARAGADRAARLRALLPDRPRHRPLRPRRGTSSARAAARRRTRRSATACGITAVDPGALRPAVRALRQRRAQRAAGHRRRLRARAPRGGDPVRLRQVRPRPRGHDRDGHLLPREDGAARRRQGARAVRTMPSRRCRACSGVATGTR